MSVSVQCAEYVMKWIEAKGWELDKCKLRRIMLQMCQVSLILVRKDLNPSFSQFSLLVEGERTRLRYGDVVLANFESSFDQLEEFRQFVALMIVGQVREERCLMEITRASTELVLAPALAPIQSTLRHIDQFSTATHDILMLRQEIQNDTLLADAEIDTAKK